MIDSRPTDTESVPTAPQLRRTFCRGRTWRDAASRSRVLDPRAENGLEPIVESTSTAREFDSTRSSSNGSTKNPWRFGGVGE
ncbi:hypothetical protein C492_14726 [Natronococcus jeotgali DSM 18795]|uniref:Uncharacterized protein n=1 Tax=Natronococcus jeotgali DSM 18795 TaxID=1227498 RepID=L9X3S2_9EURY|nr:hypothetical protein C492_14726 [Natronococcus jeotgali DSM 18795]